MCVGAGGRINTQPFTEVAMRRDAGEATAAREQPDMNTFEIEFDEDELKARISEFFPATKPAGEDSDLFYMALPPVPETQVELKELELPTPASAAASAGLRGEDGRQRAEAGVDAAEDKDAHQHCGLAGHGTQPVDSEGESETMCLSYHACALGKAPQVPSPPPREREAGSVKSECRR